MTTKMKKKKTTPTKTLKLFPEAGVLGLLTDIAITSMLLGVSFMMLLLCLQMAEKITITFGK
ncbi:MAG: hypothetical protein H7831_10950 [Magnetococcus sp. WYHC-3]